MKIWNWIAAGILLGLVLAPSASAQYGLSGGVIAGTGTVTIERMPDGMRMNITLSAKGKDLKEALAAMKDRIEAAKTQVASLGADKASLKVESPKLTAEDSNMQRRQMEMMMMERMRGGPGGARKPKKEEKPPVNISSTLTASWPLKAKEPEELLIAATAIQEKIKAADLGGLKDVKLSPEEEEAMEEMEASGYSQYSEEGPKPGEPSFHFYTAISDAEREKALAEAFVKAKERAARVAKAAGAELGKLASLNENEAGVDSDDYQGLSGADRYAYQLMAQMQGQGRGDDSAVEGIGMQPDKVKFRVSVHASFELKSP
jgi:uncharacterized protein YggE